MAAPATQELGVTLEIRVVVVVEVTAETHSKHALFIAATPGTLGQMGIIFFRRLIMVGVAKARAPLVLLETPVLPAIPAQQALL